MWRCKSALNHECIWFESKSIAILRLTFMVTDSPCLLGNALICARRIHTHVMYMHCTLFSFMHWVPVSCNRIVRNYLQDSWNSELHLLLCAYHSIMIKRSSFWTWMCSRWTFYCVNIFDSHTFFAKITLKNEHLKFHWLPAKSTVFSSQTIEEKQNFLFHYYVCK